MKKIEKKDLWSLEEYAIERANFRRQILAHKRVRRLTLGRHATLFFEDFQTIKYQIQEMLRIEKIFEPQAIDEEIEAYNPLIPDGTNWKATLMFEYPDPRERNQALRNMAGIEHQVWARVNGFGKNFGNANDDLDRTNDTKTAAVHFLRFEFNAREIGAMKDGKNIELGIEHNSLQYKVQLFDPKRTSLLQDFD